jgi:hypothetical protein
VLCSSTVRSGLCTASNLGSFITTLPAGKNLEDTSIFTSGIRFDSAAFPTESANPLEGEEDPAFDEVTSVADEVEPGLGMTATSSSHRSLPTEPHDDQREDVEPHAAADEDAEELYKGILSGEDGFRRSRRGLRQLRQRASLPSLRVGHAAGKGKRQVGDEEDEDIQDDFEDYLGDQEIDSHAVEQSEADPMEEAGDDVTATSVASRPSPTKGHKTSKPSLANGVSDSSASVPVYSAPIVYPVKKTGYYCIGWYMLQR